MAYFDAQKPSAASTRRDRVFGLSPLISDVPYTLRSKWICSNQSRPEVPLALPLASPSILSRITYPARVLEMRSYTQ